MSSKAEAFFKITDYKEETFSEADGGPRLVKGTFHYLYHGDIEGEGISSELKQYRSDSHAEMYSLQRVTGRVGNKKGTFVFEHKGKFDNGIVTSHWVIVPGSGTGDLKGLRGELDFNSGKAPEFPITLDYYFE